MLKIKEAIIVEGKYDKIRLSNIVDTLIIQTNGFSIFKDKQTRAFIEKAAYEFGIIILTDNDKAGFEIRNHIKGIIDNKYIKDAYIPDVYGKEKRKTQKTSEGKIGVEGIDDNIIIKALEMAALEQNSEKTITSADLYDDGIMGKKNSSENKKILTGYLQLPERISNNNLLQFLNKTLTYKQYKEIIQPNLCNDI